MKTTERLIKEIGAIDLSNALLTALNKKASMIMMEYNNTAYKNGFAAAMEIVARICDKMSCEESVNANG